MVTILDMDWIDMEGKMYILHKHDKIIALIQHNNNCIHI